jgi:hypothetical protein
MLILAPFREAFTIFPGGDMVGPAKGELHGGGDSRDDTAYVGSGCAGATDE